MPKAVLTKEFNKHLRDLMKGGKKGKDAAQRSKAAIADAGTSGTIQLTRTKHGETRLPNIEKYDLGDGYRLVVQLVDSANHVRAFLFAGPHDESDHWLESHRNYRWIRKESDQTLEFVQVSVSEDSIPQPVSIDLETPESLLQLPLLRDISEETWLQMSVSATAQMYGRSITAEQWERDSSGIFDHLCTLTDDIEVILLVDLLHHSHEREWNSLHRRIELYLNHAKEVSGEETARAMLSNANSDTFISWDDSDGLPLEEEWADWMLFLHPSQKELAFRELNGPARVRGVSGSGKTCVMIHRARMLAKKYKENVLLVTLTESMRRLLDILCDHLCGVERGLIKTSTMSALAKDVIRDMHPKSESWYTLVDRRWGQEELRDATSFISNHDQFSKSQLRNLDTWKLSDFLEQEMTYVRSRLLPAQYDIYPTKAFKRRGRSQALGESGRRLCLDAIRNWDASLKKYHRLDHEAIVQCAVMLLSDDACDKTRLPKYRCVLVDEVQDLSQLEVTLLASLLTVDGKFVKDVQDGLFLVGDGAQSIYPRGFSLGSIGINVGNRSFVFKKNYRNTREILAAAFGLIKSYEFADVDEDNLQRPLEPDFATRHGERPFIVKCRSLTEEGRFIASRVKELINDSEPTPASQICIIAANNTVREEVSRSLELEGISTSVLRDDVGQDSDRVKVSTIESAKGHEFMAVFIAGVADGIIPLDPSDIDNMGREASRLYVAMTRARDRLYLSYALADGYNPSRFLTAIQDECAEFEYKSGDLKPIDPVNQ